MPAGDTRVMLRIQTVIALFLLAVNICAAQDAAPDESSPATSHDAYQYYAEQEKAVWRDNAEKLMAIDKEMSDAVAALSAENAKRLQAILAENSAAHKELSGKGLRGDAHAAEYKRIQKETSSARADLQVWLQESRSKINEDHANQRAAQFESAEEQLALIKEQRSTTLARLLNSPIKPGVLTFPEDEDGQPGEQPGQVSKSDATGEELYFEHCDLCHGSRPGTRESRYDLYEAVVVDDAAYFLDRVRNGPGSMPGIDEIQALSDGQIFLIRDFVRMAGDINTGVVVVDEPEKTPDPEAGSGAGSTTNGPVAGTPVRSGLPPVTPGSPLPETGPGATEAAREAQNRSFGSADLTCNVRGDVEVNWIAPFAWNAGWIPPGASMDESGQQWQVSWMLRLRARLEVPAESNSAGHPAPGWCTYTSGSLGSAAGKSREIVIFAHSPSNPFQDFQFQDGNVNVFRSNVSSRDRGGRFATDVILAVHGVYIPATNRYMRGEGEVHGHVKRIDDRWSPGGEPAFLVIND